MPPGAVGTTLVALASTGIGNASRPAAVLALVGVLVTASVQSLHWPSAVDGCWVPSFGPKTKLLVLDALVLMSKSHTVTENALRSLAVRLYGIWRDDQNSLGYTDFMAALTSRASSVRKATPGRGIPTG